ncbi:MAG: RecX family transcriptional regulator [Bacteroidetes bacterium]|nr:RecX family transcriptional regulator [Bacteroidota bacterium]
MNGKSYTVDEAKKLMERYCLYRERNHQEVTQKLKSLGMIALARNQILEHLMQEGYLNETRFAESYARGKFLINKWGRNKIRLALKQKNISDYNLNKALQEIDESRYTHQVMQLILKKWTSLDKKTDYETMQKLKAYMLRKGYEYEEINNALAQLKENYD